jgi:hypothetical protein
MAGASVAAATAGASVAAGTSAAGASVAGVPQAANAKEAITRRLIALKSKFFFIYSSPWKYLYDGCYTNDLFGKVK